MIEQVHIVQYQHLNSLDRLFGGQSMSWMDIVSGNVARRHARTRVTTASVDHIAFFAPSFLGDMLAISGRVTYTGRTSMEIQVVVEAERSEFKRDLIQRAYFIYVAIDEEGRPVPIPPLIVETDEEKRLWEFGEKRKALRLQRQELELGS
jgi:acyl-CoA hydrolase